LFAAIGRGDLRIGTVLNYITEHAGVKKKVVKKKAPVKKKKEADKSEIIVGGMGNMLTQIARCCKPLPGDKIVGYVTLGKGVSIHRKTCINLKANKRINPGRIVSVQWGSASQSDYVVTLSILTQPRKDIAREITNCINDAGATLLGLNATPRKTDQLTKVNASAEVDSVDALKELIKKLKHLPGVEEVKRN